MTNCSKFHSFIVWIIISIAIAACSSNGGNQTTTVNVETDSQNITSLGEFPVGIRDYEPPQIEITSPFSANPVTTITDEENGYLREVIKGEKWALDVKGNVTPSTFGTEKSRLEFKGVYVNLKLGLNRREIIYRLRSKTMRDDCLNVTHVLIVAREIGFNVFPGGHFRGIGFSRVVHVGNPLIHARHTGIAAHQGRLSLVQRSKTPPIFRHHPVFAS